MLTQAMKYGTLAAGESLVFHCERQHEKERGPVRKWRKEAIIFSLRGGKNVFCTSTIIIN